MKQIWVNLFGPLILHELGRPGGFFIIFLVVVGIPAVLSHGVGHIFSAWLRRRTEANFQVLAERLGFQVKPTARAFRLVRMPPIVEGQYQGHTVRFFNHGVLGETGHWMAVAASCRTPVGTILQVGPNRWLTREAFRSSRLSMRWDGAKMATGWSAPRLQKAPTADARFDEAFLAYTNDPPCVEYILTPKVRRALLAIREKTGLLIRLRIEGGEVRYSIFGGFTVLGGFNRPDRVDHLVAQMDFVCELAEQIENNQPSKSTYTLNLV